jgi:histidinol-phosphate/aromatic aminotransferase/cobyric acid decarboxylase-like protein
LPSWARIARPWPVLEALRQAFHAADPFGPPAVRELRAGIAARWGVAQQRVVVGPSATSLLALVCRATLARGDRVVVAEPTRAMWTREPLAVGASYIDIGKDARFEVQEEPLARVLADQPGVRWVGLGAPDRPVGRAPGEAVRAAVGRAGVPLLLDTSDLPISGTAAEDPGVWSLDELAWAGVGPIGVAFLIVPVAIAERLWALCPVPELSAPSVAVAGAAFAHLELLSTLHAEARARAAAVALELEPTPDLEVHATQAPCLFLRRPEGNGETLARALAAVGLEVARRSHWSWRDGVCVGLGTASADALVAAIRRALAALLVLCAIGLGGCGREPAPPVPAPSRMPAYRSAPAATPDARPAGALPRTLGDPLVGGCGRDCQSAEHAIRGFLHALLSEAAGTAAPRFVDSSVLVSDGAALGLELSELWRTGQLGPRRERLAAWAEALARALASRGKDALLAEIDALAVNALPSRADATLAVGPETWRIRAHRRGREWLVEGLDRAP